MDIRYKTKNLLPIPSHLIAADEAPRWVDRRFVLVVRCEAGHDGIDVVRIRRPNQSTQHTVASISWHKVRHHFSLIHIKYSVLY